MGLIGRLIHTQASFVCMEENDIVSNSDDTGKVVYMSWVNWCILCIEESSSSGLKDKL